MKCFPGKKVSNGFLLARVICFLFDIIFAYKTFYCIVLSAFQKSFTNQELSKPMDIKVLPPGYNEKPGRDEFFLCLTFHINMTWHSIIKNCLMHSEECIFKQQRRILNNKESRFCKKTHNRYKSFNGFLSATVSFYVI